MSFAPVRNPQNGPFPTPLGQSRRLGTLGEILASYVRLLGLMQLQQEHPRKRLRAEHALFDVCGRFGPVGQGDGD